MSLVMFGLLKPLETNMTCGVFTYLRSGISLLTVMCPSFDCLPSLSLERFALTHVLEFSQICMAVLTSCSEVILNSLPRGAKMSVAIMPRTSTAAITNLSLLSVRNLSFRSALIFKCLIPCFVRIPDGFFAFDAL